MKLPHLQRQAGVSTLMVLSVMATLAVFVASALEYSSVMHRHSQRISTLQKATEVGDGSLMYSFGIWREICRLNSASTMPASYFVYAVPPPALYFPEIANYTATSGSNSTGSYTISNFRIQAMDPQWNILTNSSAAPPPATGQDDATRSYYYLARADISLPARGGNVNTSVRRVFKKEVISPWNWAIFYVDPLEIHPGPAFTVTGWVHSNSTLYTAHSSLTFASKVTYANDWMIGFAPGDGSHNSDIPAPPNYPANLPPALDISHQPFGLDSSRIFSNTNASDNDNSYHELIEPTDTNYADPLVGQRYWDQAGVKVVIDSSGNLKFYNEIFDSNHNPQQISNSSSNGSYDKTLYQAISGAISTGTTIQDNREGASVRLVTLDVSKVYTAINALTLPAVGNGQSNGGRSFNQIIYIVDQTAGSTGGTPKRGVKVINGAKIPNQGLTIVSGNPVYLQGDYNTGGANGSSASGSGGPPSNNASDPTKPTVTGYTRQPCMVGGDAVYVLSNGWNDSNSAASLSTRNATNTTVNTAIMSGIVPSANGNYSGGAENFPRFLEDWSGDKLTYYGSMVELYKSKQATGYWGKANVYNPPSRLWYFDTNFRLNGPPGSLMIYNYINQRWFVL